jgi:3-deoxy-D-manno-octulosonate 8-phosphate phosphatase (KDO 8-P phosphatase)
VPFPPYPAEILERAARVKLALFDVDGVLTDGKLWYSADGTELKSFHSQDGLGMKRLLANGVEIGVITARTSHIVTERTAELGIVHVYQGQEKKLDCYQHLIDALQLEPAQVCYVGDDVVDLPVMMRVGLSVAPANAHPWVSERAHWQTRLPGGAGAAREVCDLLLTAQGKADAELARWL